VICCTADPSLTYATTGRIRRTTTRNDAGVAVNLTQVFLRVILSGLVTVTAAACVPTSRMAFAPAGASVASCRELEAPAPTSVTWVIPEDPRSRARIDEVCGDLGPVVVQAGPKGPALQPVDLARLPVAIVTWNTYLGRGDLDAFVSGLRRGDLTGGDPVDAFVLLLQEVYRADILRRANAFGVHALFVPTLRRASEPDDRGNAILSTLPIGNVLIAELPFEKQRRIAVAAEIRATGPGEVARPFHVATVHLTTTVALTRGGPGAARERQAHAVVQALRALPPPIVVGGDLNTWWGDDEPAVKLLREEYPDALPLKARSTWHGPLGLATKLDYLFARTGGPPLAVERLPNRFGSDHYPVITQLPIW
jgi:endonuclease/exonuclease/phosphatase family metal-dependent hydrolase